MKPEQFEKALQEWDRAEDEAVRLEAEAFRQSRQLQEGAAATVRHEGALLRTGVASPQVGS